MGEVVNDFMIRRIAQRYAEIFKAKGHQEASKWWKEFPYVCKTDEDKTKLTEEIKRLLNME